MNRPELTAGRLLALLLCALAGPLVTELCVIYWDAAQRAAPLLILLLAAASAAAAWLVAVMTRRTGSLPPRRTLCQGCGRLGGTLICWLAMLLFLFGGGLMLHSFALYIDRLFLPQTPFYIIVTLLFFPSFYMAAAGLRVTGYAAAALCVLLPVFAVLFLMPADNYHFSFLLPLTAEGLPWASLPALFCTAPPLVAAFFLLPRTQVRHPAAPLLWFCGLLALLLATSLVLAVAFFGEKVLPQLLLPFDNLSGGRKGTFLERTDVLYLLLLMPLMGLSVSFYFISFLTAAGELIKPRLALWGGGGMILLLATCNFFGGDPRHGAAMLNALFLLLLILLLAAYGLSLWRRRRRRA